MEDRIYASGAGERFSAAVSKFNNSKRSRFDQDALYDEIKACGGSAEEADEFITLLMQD